MTLQIRFSAGESSSKVIVEAGHIYINEVPTKEHLVGARIGSQISGLLSLLGYSTENWLFVDNYNPCFEDKPIILDEEEYLTTLSQEGFSPVLKVYEADLVDQAKEVLSFLMAKHYALEHPLTGNFLLGKKNIWLYDPKKEQFKCSLLDACLYLRKLEAGDCAVTVLEKQYAPQQKTTQTILQKLGVDTSPIVPVYYASPCSAAHNSVSFASLYLNTEEKGSFSHGRKNGNGVHLVPDLITLLKLLGKVSEAVPVKTSLDLEVMKLVL